MIPLIGYSFVFGVRSIDEHVVLLVGNTILYLLNFIPDSKHHLHEVVEFGQTFALGRLNHQRAVHRERERRSMVAKVHQTFGNIILADTGLFVQLTALENHFMAHRAVLATINRAVGILKACSQIVGAENGNLRGTRQTLNTHHTDVTVGDGQNTSTTVWCSRHLVSGVAEADVTGQEGYEMLSYADRTNARTATTVRRSKGLVKVEVADVGTDGTRVGQTHLSIHVGTVHIDLRTAAMDDTANLHDVALKNTVGRGVGNHQRCQFILVGFGLGTEVVHIHVAPLVASTRYGREAGLNGRSRIRTMS